MARSRMIRPEFFDDEKLSECSVSTRLLFIALWVNSDDYGVVKGNSSWLRSQAFPYDDIPLKDINTWLIQLKKIGCILPFQSSGERYYFIRNWDRYQKVNRPSNNRNPTPPEDILTEGSLSTHGTITDETETETETETEVTDTSVSVCATRSDDPVTPASSKQALLTIPLVAKNGNKKPEQYPITQVDIDTWQESYPGIEVVQQLRAIRQWNIDNPKNRKTKSGIRRHINSWLAREQNKARAPTPKNRGRPQSFQEQTRQKNIDSLKNWDPPEKRGLTDAG